MKILPAAYSRVDSLTVHKQAQNREAKKYLRSSYSGDVIETCVSVYTAS